MDRRLELHSILTTVLGSPNVYFQPPASLVMKYPCIVYERDSEWALRADDTKYLGKKRYQITVIDRDPDSTIPDKVSELPYSSFGSHFVTDNLNHDVYNVYY